VLAAAFVADRMAEYGLEPAGDGGYLQSFPVPRDSGSSVNVLGYIPGANPSLAAEVVLVGAHLDHLGTDGVRYFPGADDNASGTAAVIEMAEALARLRGGLPRTVVFAAFSGEELGLLGSRHYVSHPSFAMAQTVYMVNLDMVGHLQDNAPLRCYGAALSPALGNLLLEIAARYPELSPSLEGNAGGSDHVPFRSVGVPTVFLHTGLTSTYHTVADTPETLDYPGLAIVARAAVELVWRIAHGSRRPTAAGVPFVAAEEPWLDHGVAPFPVPWVPIGSRPPGN
jgi:Zn-dependent M28 family amino/carboxypeptidase